MRDTKLKRQFVFTTHNANIPVFGDAGWIGVFNALDSKANLPVENQESIDLDGIRESSANVLLMEDELNLSNVRKNTDSNDRISNLQSC